MIAVCSPIESPVRGSALRGISGTMWLGRTLVRARRRAGVDFALFASRRISRRLSLSAIGASEVVSTPPEIADSVCPRAILFAAWIVAWRPVPQACPMS